MAAWSKACFHWPHSRREPALVPRPPTFELSDKLLPMMVSLAKYILVIFMKMKQYATDSDLVGSDSVSVVVGSGIDRLEC